MAQLWGVAFNISGLIEGMGGRNWCVNGVIFLGRKNQKLYTEKPIAKNEAFIFPHIVFVRMRATRVRYI